MLKSYKKRSDETRRKQHNSWKKNLKQRNNEKERAAVRQKLQQQEYDLLNKEINPDNPLNWD